MTAPDERHAAIARGAVLALLALLAALLVAWHVGHRPGPAAAALVALALVPWLLPLRGLLRGDRRTYAIAAVLAVPYLGYGLMEVLANPRARPWAAATVFASFALFVALVAYLRVTRPSPART